MLDLGDAFGQWLVFNGLSDPTGVVALMQMKQPGFIVNSLRDLQKHRQVLGFQVQFVFCSAEIEALLLYITLSVLAPVTQPLRLAGFDRHAHRLSIGSCEPQKHLVFFKWAACCWWRSDPYLTGKSGHSLIRPVANGD